MTRVRGPVKGLNVPAWGRHGGEGPIAYGSKAPVWSEGGGSGSVLFNLTREGWVMTGRERCEEIIRLIDEALADCEMTVVTVKHHQPTAARVPDRH